VIFRVASRDFATRSKWRRGAAWAKARESFPELRGATRRLCPPYEIRGLMLRYPPIGFFHSID
jgi:hypothetical protein